MILEEEKEAAQNTPPLSLRGMILLRLAAVAYQCGLRRLTGWLVFWCFSSDTRKALRGNGIKLTDVKVAVARSKRD